jgi:hypothetical protein
MDQIDEIEEGAEQFVSCLLWLSLILVATFFAGLLWIGYGCLNDATEKQSLPDQCRWDCIGGRLVPVDHVAIVADRTNAAAGSVVTASGDRLIQ